MRIYQISMRSNAEENRGESATGRIRGGEHVGFQYCSSYEEAKKYMKENPRWEGEIHMIDVPITKSGILDALNFYGRHPDNG
jgi:hypothetical protein